MRGSPDDRRMPALVEALAAAADSVMRREPVRLPVVRPAEAEALARALHDEMDAGVAARDQAIARSGHTLACARGCSACCEIILMGYEAEAVAVARYLAQDRAARDHFVEAYPRWRAAVGDLADRARDGAARGDAEAVGAAASEAALRHVLCAFNQGGACTVYAVRPNVCRGCHALDTAEHCRAGGSERPTVMEFPPLDAFMAKIRPLHMAAHAALRGAVAPEPLCDAVARLLTPVVSRNAPCPCGSGKKHKRCCGA